MKIAIVGAGISGLVLAARISKLSEAKKLGTLVKVLEKNDQCGGRVLSREVQSKNKERLWLDVGANLIDFQNEKSQKDWLQILPQKVTSSLKLLSRPFLIFQKDQFRKGDYEKNRFYYAGGFSQLVKDLKQQLNQNYVQLKPGSEVLSVRIQPPHVHVKIKLKGEQIIEETYDKVYLTCPSKQVLSLFQNQDEKEEETKRIINYCKAIDYTKQISIGFATKSGCEHFFSCVLFKNHPVLSFVCSHQQKYNQDTYVAQIAEEFSQKYFEEDDKTVSQKVFESLPDQLKQITNPIPLLVHRWPVSLIKPSKKAPSLEEMLNKHVILAGDSITGKSRVSNAVQSTSFGLSKL